MELINHLKWRYATKAYIDKKVEEDKIHQIVEAVNLSASSTGIQPYRILVISNQELKSKLELGSFNKQIEQSSHLLVFAAFNSMTNSYIEEYLQMIENQRNIPKGTLNDYKNSLFNNFESKSSEENAIWADKQAYIGLGTALMPLRN